MAPLIAIDFDRLRYPSALDEKHWLCAQLVELAPGEIQAGSAAQMSYPGTTLGGLTVWWVSALEH